MLNEDCCPSPACPVSITFKPRKNLVVLHILPKPLPSGHVTDSCPHRALRVYPVGHFISPGKRLLFCTRDMYHCAAEPAEVLSVMPVG